MKLQDLSAQEFRFRTIVELYKSGKTQVQIAQLVNCSQPWISEVLKRYKNLGEQGLKPKGKAKGASSKLTTDQIEELKSLIVQGALAHGFATDNWTRKRIAELILVNYDVSYDPAYISRLMRKIGFSLQKPIAKSYRKDEEQALQWINERLPDLKKSRS